MSEAASYEVSVQAEFCAAHALVIAGLRELVHGHNWRLTLTVAGTHLDADGLLVDFHALEAMVSEVIGRFRNADLNATPPFDRLNPSAELVAQHIGDSVQARLSQSRRGSLPQNEAPTPLCRVVSVHLTEAPGCSVVYRPQPLPPSSR